MLFLYFEYHTKNVIDYSQHQFDAILISFSLKSHEKSHIQCLSFRDL